MFISPGAKALALADITLAQKLAAYWELTKPRVSALVLAVAVAGFWLGSPNALDWSVLIGMVVGVAFLAAGIFALNQYMERGPDGEMRRTETRPLPSRRISPAEALWFGWSLSALGIVCLAANVNLLSAVIGVLTLAGYLFVYTPAKQRTPLCTLLGAFPGAAPPLLGWAAARGELTAGGWVLFLILFLWQFPHFHSIALLYQEDYAKAGFRLWTVVEPEGSTVFRQIMASAWLLLPVSLAPVLLGMAGPVYGCGAGALWFSYFYLGARTAARRSRCAAHQLLIGSVVYLPVLLVLMILKK
jgi:protoheme IX farnesyltransferase